MKQDTRKQKTPAGKNRLFFEKSPYLLQHAENPVDWYAWGEDAFQSAKTEDKPVFLSIGYSTCHWCHVMAHESFEDPDVAALMNETFVNVKVDREERPDIDAVYMSVCQMVRGNGGWPLTVILTPDAKPFFVATYLPKTGRHGMTGMMDLIPHIASLWHDKRKEIETASIELAGHLESVFARKAADAGPGPETLDAAFEEFSERFDESNAGFGRAPKFPAPHTLLFLLRYWRRTAEPRALDMVERTLRHMARGGIYDHVGFGFHRYSTDERWFAPHFEKMLYDQALLAMAYTECFLATRKEAYRKTAEEILRYVLRDVTDRDGGFYSAEDADSEGFEGKYYLWTEEEIASVLGPDDTRLAADVYGVAREGNFAEEVSGANILHMERPLEKTAEALGVRTEELERRLDGIRARLFDARVRRVRPRSDDKILADWNGLMIAALAKAARAFGVPSYADAAKKAVRFVLSSMRTADGGLRHRYRDGESAVDANLDDYAFLVWGLIELYETTFDAEHLEEALRLTDDMIRLFADEETGGFYFAPREGEAMIVRTREIYDGAIPSGNSAAAMNLVRLARLTGEARYEEHAERIGRVFHDDLTRAPSAHAWFMAALDLATGPSLEIVIVGAPGSADTDEMIRELHAAYAPETAVLFKSTADEKLAVARLAPFTALQTAIDGRATAYVCRNHACDAPTTRSADVARALMRPA
jgi:uncharacterized protein YyaL (SSP411 family)